MAEKQRSMMMSRSAMMSKRSQITRGGMGQQQGGGLTQYLAALICLVVIIFCTGIAVYFMFFNKGATVEPSSEDEEDQPAPGPATVPGGNVASSGATGTPNATSFPSSSVILRK